MGAPRMRARAMTGRSRRRSSERGDAGPGGPGGGGVAGPPELHPVTVEGAPPPYAARRAAEAGWYHGITLPSLEGWGRVCLARPRRRPSGGPDALPAPAGEAGPTAGGGRA